MSADISIPLPAGTGEFIEKMRNMPLLLRQGMRRGLDKGLALASGQIVRTRFTGEGPFPIDEHRLGVRSNRLRNAIRWNTTGKPGENNGEPSSVEGNTVRGQIGASIPYLGPHEFGYDGEVTVRAFTRHVPTRDQFAKELRTSKKTGKDYKAKVKVASGFALVRAHRRELHIKERAPLRTGIEENRGIFAEQITLGLAQAWQSSQS